MQDDGSDTKSCGCHDTQNIKVGSSTKRNCCNHLLSLEWWDLYEPVFVKANNCLTNTVDLVCPETSWDKMVDWYQNMLSSTAFIVMTVVARPETFFFNFQLKAHTHTRQIPFHKTEWKHYLEHLCETNKIKCMHTDSDSVSKSYFQNSVCRWIRDKIEISKKGMTDGQLCQQLSIHPRGGNTFQHSVSNRKLHIGFCFTMRTAELDETSA